MIVEKSIEENVFMGATVDAFIEADEDMSLIKEELETIRQLYNLIIILNTIYAYEDVMQ